MRKDYEKLTTEIDRFIEVLQYFEQRIIGIPTDDCRSFLIELKNQDESEAIFKTMKSNAIIMLYNLVEATVRTTMNEYYDHYNSKHVTYTEAIEEIKKLWVKYSSQDFKNNLIQNQVFQLVEGCIDKEYYLSLDFEKFSLSGNADLREIKNILDSHGINYNKDEVQGYGGSLLSVKNMRNLLAHGNISFEDNGKEITTSDLTAYKIQIYQCLDYFMNKVEEAKQV